MAKEQYSPSLKFYYDNQNFINYEKVGNGKKSIIFLHGFGASLNSWNDIKNGLSTTDFTLYFLDLKGFGFSSKPQIHTYSIEEQSEIVIAFLKSNEIHYSILVGHSYGGSVALLTTVNLRCEQNDSIVNELILIDPGAFADELPFFVKFLRNPVTNFLSRFMSEDFRAKQTLKKLYHNKSKINTTKINRYSYFFKIQGFNQAISNAAKNIVPDNYQHYIDQYSNIKIPVLIIWGVNDPIFSIESAERLNKLIPASKLEKIPDCGHIPQEECPRQTLEIINNYLHGNS